MWSKVSASLERPTERHRINPEGIGDWILVYGASGLGKSPPIPIEKWLEPDFLFRWMKEDGRFVKKPTGNTHEVSMAFTWMPETPVPIKEDPSTPPPPQPPKPFRRPPRELGSLICPKCLG